MKLLLQRVKEASVTVGGEVVGAIDQGLLLFVGIEPFDSEEIVKKGIERAMKYRIFSDDAGKMNLSLIDRGGDLLLVSQFTLAADTDRGLRPSFTSAAAPALGEALFDYAVSVARSLMEKSGAGQVATGRFGADMQVALINDGPVTFLLETR
ncbi:D-aminoacyl-tRNA deacylase [Ignatzschineria indica]|uniref:D-aminoacyl-tRNA deacylase n=1 Tax=Ignatzschineria indica TaxID=472583 RepID=A0A2U2AML3_9GAMM|nr:D-aminoacyl-tRNA deacylase [Ignatzschineria indica]PWD84451.1 D-tyrosyl-tRNA(Tyr) deacylase [Ignatzschineria indica]GGZ76523.1 D-aminoacyl-tRNA deacylase [Ignatzschineria indica]